jgi:hypothetical protein
MGCEQDLDPGNLVIILLHIPSHLHVSDQDVDKPCLYAMQIGFADNYYYILFLTFKILPH